MCLIYYQKFRGALKFLARFATKRTFFAKNGKIRFEKAYSPSSSASFFHIKTETL